MLPVTHVRLCVYGGGDYFCKTLTDKQDKLAIT